MKKFFMLFAAAAAAFCLVSCSKAGIDNLSKEIKLNIKVADLNGLATKAVKTGWESGDKINIWFDSNSSWDPDLVIKYDGTTWDIDKTVTTSGELPAASGRIKFFFEGNNDLSKYTRTIWEIVHGFAGTANLLFSEDYYKPTYYTYSGGVLEFEISNWLPLSEFQVVITGIDPEDYQLKCDQLQTFTEIEVRPDETNTTSGLYGEFTDGVANADGAAFYFRGTDSPDVSADYKFTLKNKTTGFENTYTATGKTHSHSTFTAIKIPDSKFFY